MGWVLGNDSVILRERNFQALMLATVLSPLGSLLVSPALDSLIGPFGATPGNIGLMISVFSAPMVVSIPIGGLLADRVGRKPVLTFSLVIGGLAGTAIAFTTDYGVVLALRFCQGIGFGGILPMITTSIGDQFGGAREATGQGLRITVSGASSTLFPLLAGVLVGLAWQLPFLLYAISLPVTLVVYRWYDEPVGAPDSVASGLLEGRSYRRALFEFVRQRRVWSLVLSQGLTVVVWIAFVTYNSIVVVRLFGDSAVEAGLLAAVASVGFALSATQAGRVQAAFDGPLIPLLGAQAAIALGFGVFTFAPGLPVGLIGVACMGVGYGITGALYRSTLNGYAPDRLRAGVVSLASAAIVVAFTVTPVAMGVAITALSHRVPFGPALQFVSLGTLLAATGVAVLLLVVSQLAPPIAPEWRSST